MLPLPLYEPSVYTAHNELRGGQMVLALYPDTTCFYKVLTLTLNPSPSPTAASFAASAAAASAAAAAAAACFASNASCCSVGGCGGLGLE